MTAESILGEVSAPLALFLQLLGYDVLALGWDRPLALHNRGPRLGPGQRVARRRPSPSSPHSAGGILAHCIYGQMVEHGQARPARADDNDRHAPLWVDQAGAALVPLADALPGLAAIVGWTNPRPNSRGPAYLDAVLGTMPSWYELQAFAAVGPLFDQYPSQASQIYQSGFYSGVNSSVSGPLLLAAEDTQGAIAALLPAAVMQSIAGDGQKTAYALNQPGDPSRKDGYLYTQDGDGLVTVAQASPPGVAVHRVAVGHGLQPLHPLVWTLVAGLLP